MVFFFFKKKKNVKINSILDPQCTVKHNTVKHDKIYEVQEENQNSQLWACKIFYINQNQESNHIEQSKLKQ
jgi:hypothetical protein